MHPRPAARCALTGRSAFDQRDRECRGRKVATERRFRPNAASSALARGTRFQRDDSQGFPAATEARRAGSEAPLRAAPGLDSRSRAKSGDRRGYGRTRPGERLLVRTCRSG